MKQITNLGAQKLRRRKPPGLRNQTSFNQHPSPDLTGRILLCRFSHFLLTYAAAPASQHSSHSIWAMWIIQPGFIHHHMTGAHPRSSLEITASSPRTRGTSPLQATAVGSSFCWGCYGTWGHDEAGQISGQLSNEWTNHDSKKPGVLRSALCQAHAEEKQDSWPQWATSLLFSFEMGSNIQWSV